ncbi:MAG: SCP2 sterol-binding domain-containing protein [Candidatus Thorarchaeota archaeon]
MVNEDLIKELLEVRDKGSDDPSVSLKAMEFYRQIAEESENITEELKDVNIMMQVVVTDPDYKYWGKMANGKLEYGEGEVENPNCTMAASWKTWSDLSSGELDSTSAYMAGDLTIEGNLQDAISYGQILAMIMEEGREYE